MKEKAGYVGPVIPFTAPPPPLQAAPGSSENAPLRGHIFFHFPPPRSTGGAYPGVSVGSVCAELSPGLLGHKDLCFALVGLCHP